MPEMSDFQAVLAALLFAAAVFFFGCAITEYLRLRAEDRRAEKQAAEDPRTEEQRYLDWLEGLFAGMVDNDVETQGDGPK